MLAMLVGVGIAFAASLPGSNFEIDTNANLKVDGAVPPSLDWANVTETRKADSTSGAGDNSFGNGTKEDTPVPSVVSGSIPPNKSDLLNFGVYLETTSSGSRFLNLFWHRVQEPSGTTNMDFEFNQASTLSANGVTPVRTAGDLLIQYDLSQGGTNPQLFLSRWVTSGATSQCAASNQLPCWSTKTNLTAAGDATGSINTTAIPALQADGLGAISPRTFGEAQIDFDALAGGTGNCASFGSAYLKSRSSDSFTAALKDFIAPAQTNLSNCAKVTIRKETSPEENPNATSFGFTKTFPTGVASANTFTLQDDGTKSYTDVKQGTGYTVDEDVIPAGWDLQNIDCNVTGHPSSGVTPNISVANGTVTFDIDSASDVLDCTYTNQARGAIVVEKITSDGSGAFDFTSTTLTPSPFTLTTTAEGAAGKDSRNFSDLAPGDYDVAETVPDGWDLTSSTCSSTDSGDTSTPSNISLSASETVTCTFTNAQQRGKIVVEKVTNGGTDTFEFTSGTLSPSPFELTTTAQGAAGKDSETFDNLIVGTYDVAETDKTGWDLTSSTCSSTDSGDTSTPSNISLSASETVTCTFTNTKRGNIVVEKVTSGGSGAFDFTSTTLTPSPFTLTTTAEGAAGKDSRNFSDLAPGDYDVAEDVPDGWDLTSSTCSSTDSGDTSTPSNISLNAGETVTCTFNNAKKATEISTEQSFIPQDTATIGGTGSGTFNGQVDFELYKGEDCTGTPVYFERNVSLPASGTLETTNTEYTISGDGTGEYHWKVSYHDDTNGHPNASSCVEESTVTIDDDNTTP